MSKSKGIIIAVIVLILIGAFFLFSGSEDQDQPQDLPTQVDQETHLEKEGYDNLDTDDEVFNAIDESLELLE